MSESPAFDPVPSATTRHDGWTADKQRGFLVQLARLGVVAAAARAVGMSAQSAYKLRNRDGAASFAAAWDEAALTGRKEAFGLSIDRAINGVMQPVFRGGVQVGERRAYNDRLLMAAIRVTDHDRRESAPELDFEAALASLSSTLDPSDALDDPPAPG